MLLYGFSNGTSKGLNVKYNVNIKCHTEGFLNDIVLVVQCSL